MCLLVLVKTIPNTLKRGEETQTAIQWSSSIFLPHFDEAREGKRGYKVIQACHRGDLFVCSSSKDSYFYIYSLLFVGGSGPIKEDPDPISAIASKES